MSTIIFFVSTMSTKTDCGQICGQVDIIVDNCGHDFVL